MRTIFHIDVNCAFLSWEAVHRLNNGERLDLRSIPSAVGGDEKSRRGVVLAKSIPAKRLGVKTGEPIYLAREKCPRLVLVSPTPGLYSRMSAAFAEYLNRFSPIVEQYSIDECFLDYSFMEPHFGAPLAGAEKIKNAIKRDLGFTVNIGISENKLLAKMASDFEKPDRVHTLFPHEIEKKLWPLPVGDLFMVGRHTAPLLNGCGIYTIGQLAKADIRLLRLRFKSMADTLKSYANGVDCSGFAPPAAPKSIGNSTTTPADIRDKSSARLVLLTLAETVGARLRESAAAAGQLTLTIKTAAFKSFTHGARLPFATSQTMALHREACRLFDEMWQGEPLRLLGLTAGRLEGEDCLQTSLFGSENKRGDKLDSAIDRLRRRYGAQCVMRAGFVGSRQSPILGKSPTHNPPGGAKL